ncbi:unnamed protein product [Symbiodinium microadriaticum]|nr:unnamed protein product [Symbiodinium microadriaticum]
MNSATAMNGIPPPPATGILDMDGETGSARAAADDPMNVVLTGMAQLQDWLHTSKPALSDISDTSEELWRIETMIIAACPQAIREEISVFTKFYLNRLSQGKYGLETLSFRAIDGRRDHQRYSHAFQIFHFPSEWNHGMGVPWVTVPGMGLAAVHGAVDEIEVVEDPPGSLDEYAPSEPGLDLDEVEPDLLESLFQERDLDSIKALELAPGNDDPEKAPVPSSPDPVEGEQDWIDDSQLEAEIRDATTGVELVTLRYFVGLKSKTGSWKVSFIRRQKLPPRIAEETSKDVLCITNEVRAFDPRGYHAVRKNPDWVIVGYSPLGVLKLNEVDKDLLKGLGFRVPMRFEEEHQVKVVRQHQESTRAPEQSASSNAADQNPLAQDEQPDTNTTLVGWDLSEGARRNQPTGDSLPRDLQLFLWERDIEYLLPELQRLGIEEREDLIYLFEVEPDGLEHADHYEDEVLQAQPAASNIPLDHDPPPWDVPAHDPPPWEIPSCALPADLPTYEEEPAPEPVTHVWEDEWTPSNMPAGYGSCRWQDTWHPSDEDMMGPTDESVVAKVVHQVAPADVRGNLDKWRSAAQEELNSLVNMKAIKRHKGVEAQQLLRNSGIETIPAKCVFTVKPGKPYRRKVRIVSCGNYAQGVSEDVLYASGAAAETLRAVLVRYKMKAAPANIPVPKEWVREVPCEEAGYSEAALRDAQRVFTDASFAPYSEKSISGIVVQLAGRCVFWKSRRQSIVSLSTAECLLIAACEGVVLAQSIQALASELLNVQSKIVLKVDNVAAITLAEGGGSQRTRHLRARANFLKEMIDNNQLTVNHCPGERQLADTLTKALPAPRLELLNELLGISSNSFGDPLISSVATTSRAFRGLDSREGQGMILIMALLMVQLQPVTSQDDDEGEPVDLDLYLVAVMMACSVLFVWEVGKHCFRHCMREPTAQVASVRSETDVSRRTRRQQAVRRALERETRESSDRAAPSSTEEATVDPVSAPSRPSTAPHVHLHVTAPVASRSENPSTSSTSAPAWTSVRPPTPPIPDPPPPPPGTRRVSEGQRGARNSREVGVQTSGPPGLSDAQLCEMELITSSARTPGVLHIFPNCHVLRTVQGTHRRTFCRYCLWTLRQQGNPG